MNRRAMVSPPLVALVKSARRLLAKRPTLLELDGLRVVVPHRDRRRYLEGFEPLTLDWVRTVVEPGMQVVDVGAAVGVFALELMRLVGAAGRVDALEPAPANLRLLRLNLRLNEGARDIHVLPLAAAAADGVRVFHLTESSDSHAFIRHPLIAPRRVINVRAVRLDSVLAQVDFLKIDVEGAELEVLEGATRVLRDRPPLVVEWVPSCQVAAGREAGDLPEWLRLAGYNCRVFDELNRVETTVDDVLQRCSSGEVPPNWYANLCCKSLKHGSLAPVKRA